MFHGNKVNKGRQGKSQIHNIGFVVGRKGALNVLKIRMESFYENIMFNVNARASQKIIPK